MLLIWFADPCLAYLGFLSLCCLSGSLIHALLIWVAYPGHLSGSLIWVAYPGRLSVHCLSVHLVSGSLIRALLIRASRIRVTYPCITYPSVTYPGRLSWLIHASLIRVTNPCITFPGCLFWLHIPASLFWATCLHVAYINPDCFTERRSSCTVYTHGRRDKIAS